MSNKYEKLLLGNWDLSSVMKKEIIAVIAMSNKSFERHVALFAKPHIVFKRVSRLHDARGQCFNGVQHADDFYLVDKKVEEFVKQRILP